MLTFIPKKIKDIYYTYTHIICPRHDFFCDNNLLKRIRNSCKPCLFLVHFFNIRYRKCRLNVTSFVSFVYNKINLSRYLSLFITIISSILDFFVIWAFLKVCCRGCVKNKLYFRFFIMMRFLSATLPAASKTLALGFAKWAMRKCSESTRLMTVIGMK